MAACVTLTEGLFVLDYELTMNRLPPLNTLRTFEAVARLSSFKLAAEELFVTQGAISQQIKNLEVQLGVCLFIRNVKGLELTYSALKLLPEVSQAFKILNNAVSEIEGSQQTISVCTSTSFAMLWLMMRSTGFEKVNPDISIYLNAAGKFAVADLISQYDLEVHYRPDRESVETDSILISEWLLPVCSPEFKSSQKPSFEMCTEYRLLLNSPEANDWKAWFKAHGINLQHSKRALKKAVVLPTDASAIEMAIGGYGIALANLHYVADKLRSNLLVPAFDIEAYELGVHYFKNDQHFLKTAVSLYLDWLRDQARLSHQSIEPWLKATPT